MQSEECKVQSAERTASVTGVVLAGGKSRRLGRDKATLRWPPDDPGARTLLDLTVSRLAQVCDDVLVVGDRAAEEVPAGARIVADRYPDAGSLGGICTGLEAARHERTLVVATDMPFLDVALLRWLASQQGEWDALVPVWDDRTIAGPPEPLHAVYRKSCLPVLRGRIEAGQLRIHELLRAVRTREVRRHEYAPLDPEGRSFFNLNAPEDLEQALRMAGERKTAHEQDR
jgi:molybdenum cofactor guanylyltransferase